MNKCKTCVHNLVCCHLSDSYSDFYAYHGYRYDFENCPHYKDNDSTPLRFVFMGYNLPITLVAPSDITLKQLLQQCDRIEPQYYPFGIRTEKPPFMQPDLTITYDTITKNNEDDDYFSILPEVSK